MSDALRRKILIGGGVALLIFVVIIFFAIHSSKKSGYSAATQTYPAGKAVPTLAVKPTTAANAALPQLLNLTFSYNADTQALAITDKVQINGVAQATSDPTLPYELWEVDGSNTIIFDTRFAVATAAYVDSPYNRSGMQQLKSTQTTVSVPFAPNAKTIIVTKDNKRVLVFPIQ